MFIISRTDYHSALLVSLPASATKPLQMIQNSAACLVFNQPKRLLPQNYTLLHYFNTLLLQVYVPFHYLQTQRCGAWWFLRSQVQRPSCPLCCELLQNNDTKDSFRLHQNYFQISTGMNWTKVWNQSSTATTKKLKIYLLQVITDCPLVTCQSCSCYRYWRLI